MDRESAEYLAAPATDPVAPRARIRRCRVPVWSPFAWSAAQCDVRGGRMPWPCRFPSASSKGGKQPASPHHVRPAAPAPRRSRLPLARANLFGWGSAPGLTGVFGSTHRSWTSHARYVPLIGLRQRSCSSHGLLRTPQSSRSGGSPDPVGEHMTERCCILDKGDRHPFGQHVDLRLREYLGWEGSASWQRGACRRR